MESVNKTKQTLASSNKNDQKGCAFFWSWSDLGIYESGILKKTTRQWVLWALEYWILSVVSELKHHRQTSFYCHHTCAILDSQCRFMLFEVFAERAVRTIKAFQPWQMHQQICIKVLKLTSEFIALHLLKNVAACLQQIKCMKQPPATRWSK